MSPMRIQNILANIQEIAQCRRCAKIIRL